MSTRPVTACMVASALKGDVEQRALTIDRLKFNIQSGENFTVWQCRCRPRCKKPSKDRLVFSPVLHNLLQQLQDLGIDY